MAKILCGVSSELLAPRAYTKIQFGTASPSGVGTYTSGTAFTIGNSDYGAAFCTVGVSGISGSIGITTDRPGYLTLYGYKNGVITEIANTTSPSQTFTGLSFSGYDILYIGFTAGSGFDANITITES